MARTGVTFDGRLVGENLRRLRAEQEISLTDLAVWSGVERSHIAKIEKGTRNVHRATVVSLARGLRVKPNELVGDTWEPPLTRRERYRRLLDGLETIAEVYQRDRIRTRKRGIEAHPAAPGGDEWERLIRLYEFFLDLPGGSFDGYFDLDAEVHEHYGLDSLPRRMLYRSDVRSGRITEPKDYDEHEKFRQTWQERNPAPRQPGTDVLIPYWYNSRLGLTRASRYAVVDVARDTKQTELDGSFGADAIIVNQHRGTVVPVPVYALPNRNEFAVLCTTDSFSGFDLAANDVVIVERRPTGYYEFNELVFVWWSRVGHALVRVRNRRGGVKRFVTATGEVVDVPRDEEVRVLSAVMRVIRPRAEGLPSLKETLAINRLSPATHRVK